jgi:20S proteasome alpha/beta subunit
MAAGFQCKNGVVICADTEMSIAGLIKYPESKIRVYGSLGTKPVFTFAGDANFCGMCMEKFAYAIRDTKTNKLSVLEASILNQARWFHENYLNDEYEKESTLIMSLWWPPAKKRLLYEISRGVVARIKGVSSCGTGSAVTRGMISELFSTQLSTQEVALLAIYFLAEAKTYGDGVGKDSEIVILYNTGTVDYFPEHPCSPSLKEIEEDYIKLKRLLRPILASYSDVNTSKKEFARILKDFERFVTNQREQRRAAYDSLMASYYHYDED